MKSDIKPFGIPILQVCQFPPMISDSEEPIQSPITDSIKSLSPDRWQRTFCEKHSKGRTAPRLLILCQSAIRAAEIYDQLKFTIFNGQVERKAIVIEKTKVNPAAKTVSEVRVAKLFGKHFKVEEQLEFLNKTPVSIAVGTPGRIQQIFEADSNLLQKLEWLVFDAQLNSKGFTIFETFDTSKPLFEFLFKTCEPILSSGKLKVCLY